MIDIVFLLLIYFLLITELSPSEEAFAVTVTEQKAAQTSDPFDLPTRPVRVRIRSFGDGAGEYAITTDSPLITAASSYEDLFTQVFSRKGGVFAGDQAFVIEASRSTRWEHAMGVFNALKRADFEKIRFAPPSIPEGT